MTSETSITDPYGVLEIDVAAIAAAKPHQSVLGAVMDEARRRDPAFRLERIGVALLHRLRSIASAEERPALGPVPPDRHLALFTNEERERLKRLEPMLVERVRVFSDAVLGERRRARDAEARAARIAQLEAPLRARDVEALRGDRLRPTGPLEAVRRWCEQDAHPILGMVGNPGVGKTLAACWWLTSSVESESERLGAYVTARDLVRSLRADFGRPDARYLELMRERWLVVDGWGTEDRPSDGAAVLLELIASRAVPRHRTLLIGSGSVAEFVSAYAEQDSRLRDLIRADVLLAEFGGPSLRPGVSL